MPNVAAAFISPLAHAARRATTVVAGLRKAWSRRGIVGQLGMLDEHMLRDIGITRHDLLSVLAEPFYRDRSEILALRADEARRARQSASAQLRQAEQAGRRNPAEADRRAA